MLLLDGTSSHVYAGGVQNFIRTIEHVMFSNHQELRVVNLSRNEIEFIPEGLSKLPLLEVLDLSYNHIRAVPECLSDLKALRSVDLSHNSIRTVGGMFERTVGLAALDLTSNPDLDVEHLPLRTRRLYEKVSRAEQGRAEEGREGERIAEQSRATPCHDIMT
jgi:hypothetical protein